MKNSLPNGLVINCYLSNPRLITIQKHIIYYINNKRGNKTNNHHPRHR